MIEGFQKPSPSAEASMSAQEKLHEDANKARGVLKVLNLEKKLRVLTQNELKAVEKEISELQGETVDDSVEVKYTQYGISSDEELLKRYPTFKDVIQGERQLRIIAKGKLVLAKAKLEQLKNEKPNVPAETPEIEITPSEPVEGSNDGISLGKSWNLSERASVLQTLTNLENQSLISKREREELMEANTKLVESFNQFEDEYRAKDTVRTAAQIRLILSIKEQLVGTQVKVASLTEDLNATRGRGIETLKELIATQNDLAEVRKNLVSSEKNGRQLEADLAETRRELVSSEKKVKQLDAEVMALLEILKKNDIVIQP